MEKPAINIQATGGEPVIIHLLEGRAPEHQNLPLKSVSINGNIDSVSAYVSLRESIIDRNKAVVYFNEESRSITLDTDPAHPLTTLVSGRLVPYPEFAAFKMNGGGTFNQKEIETLIKMSRVFFADADENKMLVDKLRKFSAKVDREYVNESNNQGNKKAIDIKNVTADVPLDFVLNIPVFKGLDHSKFRVEICYDVTDGGVRFWLESVEVAEIMKQVLFAEFEKAHAIIEPLGITIIKQ